MAKKKYVEYFKKKFKTIEVPFDELMGEQFSDYTQFMLILSVKKIFAKEVVIDRVTTSNNDILNRLSKDEIESFLYTYASIKMSLDNNQYSKDNLLEEFINDINLLFSEELLKNILEYVSENDHTKIVVSKKRPKYHDAGKTFGTPEFNALYTVTMIIRFIVPLVTHCAKLYNIPHAQEFIFDVFMQANKITAAYTHIDPISKLHSYLKSSLDKTESNFKIWDKLSITSVTSTSTNDLILSNIITTILIKFDFMEEESDSNVIKLCDTVIRQEIYNWCFKKPFPLYMKELSEVEGASGDDDTIISEADMFETQNRPEIDTFDLMAIKIGIDDTIQKIRLREGLSYSVQEFEYYKDRLITHDYQKVVIFEMFNSYFGGSLFMNSVPHYDWVKLVILAKKKLEQLGLKEISLFLSAERDSFVVNRRLSPTFEESIYSHEKYHYLRNTKYKMVKSYFDNKKFIKHTIMLLCNNVFKIHEFNNELNGVEISLTGDVIRDKILDYYCVL